MSVRYDGRAGCTGRVLDPQGDVEVGQGRTNAVIVDQGQGHVNVDVSQGSLSFFSQDL